jgi:hypothetical protein
MALYHSPICIIREYRQAAVAGTTSISEALNQLGVYTHHFCAPMVKLERRSSAVESNAVIRDGAAAQSGYMPRLVLKYSDRFDGQTDLAPVLVLEQLLQAYPTAKFVYTRRPMAEWAKAMVRFVGEEPRRSLFKWHPTPSRFYAATYGENWAEYSPAEWSEAYTRHERRVRKMFEGARAAQLLELDITQMAKEGLDSEIWAKLCAFIGAPQPQQQVHGAASSPQFPHRLVFTYSAVDQPLRQVQHAAARLAATTWLIGLLALTVALVRFWDLGQCTRVCRVANGLGGTRADGSTAVAVAGRFGSWFEPSEVFGVRWPWLAAECACYNSSSASALAHARVPRLHHAIDTTEQWWFLNTTTRVCGSDGREYETAALVQSAVANGARVSVANCGHCGRCSSVSDVDVMHRWALTLTKRASVGGIVFLFLGEHAYRFLVRSSFIGFSAECGECWLEATRCNLASCAQHCLFGWANPLSTPSTKNGSTDLNECMHCDEVHCSAYYLQACGANRRTAGVTTDVARPGGDICQAASWRGLLVRD